MGIRNIIFSNRSYTPIPIVLIMIYHSDPIILYLFYGFFLLIVGESIRMYSVRYAGGITRTINVGAPELCTSGPYSRTRNPLYIGNMLIYLGVVLIAGGKYLLILFLIVIIYFIIQYSMIISLEEEKLNELFGKKYEEFCNNVPRIFPRLKPWKNINAKNPLSIKKTLKTEKRTLQNIFFVLLLIFFKDHFVGTIF
tara:strand:- start:69 stop:656 length:588 start_codon:yes stop_codon:yes gene_type:complete